MNKTAQDQIVKVVDLAASPSRVWRALTDHQEFGLWFGVNLDSPFKVGEVTTGFMSQPGHEHVKWISTTEKLTPETLFVFSWPPSAIDPDTHYEDDAKVIVEFHLQPSQDGTTLTITESGFLQFPETKRLDVLRSNTEGWNIQAANVTAHVTA